MRGDCVFAEGDADGMGGLVCSWRGARSRSGSNSAGRYYNPISQLVCETFIDKLLENQ